ncbi:uncharacterized protein TNCV_1246011 [Trichonephila clavipes]|uniref:Uncharacterized protein n=1 Tax=Trichonephila clavipes TaxID=2585209 RepID=A0A8X6UST2_TRICX|nr:uncharacterized protein TNCV_1246011 [Trichonephila clavipes]
MGRDVSRHVRNGHGPKSSASALYEKDIDKVEFHIYKDSSHTFESTAAYLEKKESETEIKCIPFDEIPVTPLAFSPMDFCAFGLLKKALRKRHPRTLNVLWKTLQDE